MSTITPFLWFGKGQMADALAFYLAVFPGGRIVSQNPMGAEIELLGQRIMMLGAESRFELNEAFSLFVSCKDQAEVDHYWSALTADGGSESRCGWLKDKFGLSWQVIPEALSRLLGDPDPARRQRAVQAMLQMRKIVIADLEKAADG